MEDDFVGSVELNSMRCFCISYSQGFQCICCMVAKHFVSSERIGDTVNTSVQLCDDDDDHLDSTSFVESESPHDSFQRILKELNSWSKCDSSVVTP